MTITDWGQVIILIVVIVLSLTLSIGALRRAIREGFTRRRIAIFVSGLGILFITYLAYNLGKIQPSDWAQIMLMLGLVAVTGVYALSAARQADASVEMAEEMREQRYDAVRPVIDIERKPRDEDKMAEAIAASEGNTSRGLSCVLHNIGLGPAIDLYSFVQNPFSGERQRHDFGTLAKEAETYNMNLSVKQEGDRMALVSYYKDVYGRLFESSRGVVVDKNKGWIIDPLRIRQVREDELP